MIGLNGWTLELAHRVGLKPLRIWKLPIFIFFSYEVLFEQIKYEN
jgi:hypothetical protein